MINTFQLSGKGGAGEKPTPPRRPRRARPSPPDFPISIPAIAALPFGPVPVEPPPGLWQALARTDRPMVDDIDRPGEKRPSAHFWPMTNPAGARASFEAERAAVVFGWLQDLVESPAPTSSTMSSAMSPTTSPAAALAALMGISQGSVATDPKTGLSTPLMPLVVRAVRAIAGDNAPEFVFAWWRYIDWRWNTYGEWPDAATQLATLVQMPNWRYPALCLMQSVSSSFKAVFPLREDLEVFSATGKTSRYQEYEEGLRPMVLRSSRSGRGVDSRSNPGESLSPLQRMVRDSVPFYRMKAPSQ